MSKAEWTKESLWELRKEIVLNSMFVIDYENSFGVDARAVCDFFDGFCDYIAEDYDDFETALKQEDNPESLWGWYLCFVSEPLERESEVPTYE